MNIAEGILIIVGVLMLVGMVALIDIQDSEVQQCTEHCKTKMEHGVAVYTPIDGKCVCEFSSDNITLTKEEGK